jgi:hypothetical protein
VNSDGDTRHGFLLDQDRVDSNHTLDGGETMQRLAYSQLDVLLQTLCDLLRTPEPKLT